MPFSWKDEHDAELGLRKEWSARAQKAEAEVERLRLDLADMAESLRLTLDWQKLARPQIKLLRAALKPFADQGRSMDTLDRDYKLKMSIPAGWLADAKAAMAPAHEQSKETKP